MWKIFKRGLITLAPLTITIAIAIWLLVVLEDFFSVPLKKILGQYYFPGFGIVFSLVLIFFVGVFINTWIMSKFYGWGEKLIQKIPLLKSLYGAIHDVLNYFQMQKKGKKVVRINVGGMYLLGFITRESFSDLPQGIADEGTVAVYLPMSYQIGGYSVIVPKDKIEPLDMSVEEAMRYIIIGGARKSE